MNKAIVVASFGTTYVETREKTIDQIVRDIESAFPEADVFQSYTSSIVRRRVEKNEGRVYLAPEAMLEKLIGEGYKEIYIQSTHIIPGFEYHKITRAVADHSRPGVKIELGLPLLYSQEDYEDIVGHYSQVFSDLAEDQAVLFMSHGTDHEAFTSYTTLDYMLMGTNVMTSCVEGYPGLDISLERLEAGGYKRIELYPFMIVAGDHAHNDMVGKRMDTWQGRLEAEGYQVQPHLKGLGEDKFIRDKFIDKLALTMEGGA